MNWPIRRYDYLANAIQSMVEEAWYAYRDLLNSPITGDAQANQRIFERRDDAFWDLLHAMSQSLGYPFDRTAIKNGAYIPILHGDIFSDQELIRTGVAALLNGQRFLKVVAYKPERSLDDVEGFWTLQIAG